MTPPYRILANLTLQSHRQLRRIESRLVQHPGTSVSLRSRTSSVNSNGALEEVTSTDAELIPSLANWDVYDNDLDPMAWSVRHKLFATGIVTYISWLVQFASSVDAGVTEGIEAEFGVGRITSSLATALFLIGFAFGAPLAGPLSELAGRNPVYLTSLLFFGLATLGSALSPSLSVFLMFRFLAGMFGSTPLVCAGGTIFDLWPASSQLYAFPAYSTGAFLGMPSGPPIGAMIAAYTGSWRTVEWFTLTQAGIIFLLVLMLQPETCAPVMLKWKTRMIIEKMKPEERQLAFMNGTWHSQKFGRLLRQLTTALWRSIQLSIHEPIILVISIYLSVLYLIVFALLPGYYFIYSQIYHMPDVLRNMAFYGIAAGFLIAGAIAVAVGKHLRQQMHSNDGEIIPEKRLLYAMYGSPAVPAALFWMAWTSREDVSFWSPIASSVLLGMGVMSVFFSCYQYIIHAYGKYAASGLVFITFARYILAGVMVVAGVPMYEKMGVAWASSTLTVLGLLLVPIPFVLAEFGLKIRSWSRLSSTSQR